MDLSTRQGRHEQGQLIQTAVERAGLSVEDLANRIGCSRALIYQYLSGTTLAQPDRLQRIARETGVPLTYFFGETAQPQKSKPSKEQADVRRSIADSIRRLEELARYQSSPPDWQAVASTSEQIISLAAPAEDEDAQARALLNLGRARVHMGEFSRAIEPLSQAIDLFSGKGEKSAVVDARQTLGHALLAIGRSIEARQHFALVAASDQWQGRWSGTVSLAGVAEQLGQYREAMAYCDEAHAILEQGTNEIEVARGILYVNANRVNLYMAGGDFLSARSLAERCLADAEAQGNSDQHLEARLNLGMCALWLGEWAISHQILSAAGQLARFLHDKGREAMARATFAILLAAMCDCDTCIEQAKDALSAALSQGDHRVELFAQIALADAYFALDRDSEARYHANQALAVASSMRLPLYEVECRLRIARLSLRCGDLEEASDALQKALSAAERLGARHLVAQIRLTEGEMQLSRQDPVAARDSASEASRLAEEMRLKPLAWEADLLLARAENALPERDLGSALESVTRAVQSVDELRVQLRDAGIADTLLEDRQRLAGYRLRADLLQELGRSPEAEEFIESAAWPPLRSKRRG